MSNPATKSYRWLFCLLAVLGLALDLGSKYGVFAWLAKAPPNPQKNLDREFEVVPDVFYLAVKFTNEPAKTDNWRSPLRTLSSDWMPEVNHGALWGIGGKDENGADFNHIFALISVLAAAAIIVWSGRASTVHDLWLCVALGLILAGTLGNLYDRVIFHGVRDFLQWVYYYNFPRFNVADSCLVCGAALLLLQAFFAPEKPAQNAAGAVSAESVPQTETIEVK